MSSPATSARTSRAATIRSAELDEQETLLPKLSVGEQVFAPDVLDARLIVAGVDPKGHQTTPPPRFTEASLVKRLEEEGIGRPSTYAPTVATIQRRGYVSRQGKAMVPSFTAFAVTRLLREHFSDYVDLGFTAEMEEILDQISNGEKDWLDFIREFYRGDGKHHGLEHLVEDKDQEIGYPVIHVCDDPESGLPVRVRIGRYGPFLQVGETAQEGPARVAARRSRAGRSHAARRRWRCSKPRPKDRATLGRRSGDRAERLHHARPLRAVRAARRNADGQESREAAPRLARHVQFSEEHDHARRRAAASCRCRASSAHADDGETIVANVGRFGPYVKHGSEFRSLAPEDDVYTVTLERAKALLAQEKKSMRRQRTAPKELRALGAHPDSGAPVEILDGRYGPYVTDGTTNASLPKGTRARGVDHGRRQGAARGARRRREAVTAGAPRRRVPVARRAKAKARARWSNA